MKMGWVRYVGLVVSLVACGSDDDAGPSNGEHVSTLSSVDQGKLCDWMVEQLGDYDSSFQCGDETRTIGSRQECIDGFAEAFVSCERGTVGQFRACVSQMLSDPCDESKTEGGDCATFNEACGD